MLLNRLPDFIRENYEVHEWKHASAVLISDFLGEWDDIVLVLTAFRLRRSWIATGSGRKSQISEFIDRYLYERGWVEKKFETGVMINGVGFYFRNVTEVLLFGVRGKNARTLAPGRSQENIIVTQKREHSRKPDEQYDLIEHCSFGRRLELFARGPREGWTVWGNQSEAYTPTWNTYSNHSQSNILNLRATKK